MVYTSLFAGACFAALANAVALPVPDAFPTTSSAGFVNWTTFKANGVNLGAWLEKEKSFDLQWWDQVSPNTRDEWSICKSQGLAYCGLVLEQRYRTYINISTIDQLASQGVNTLRIPMTYASWIKVPGSYLWTGSQVAVMQELAFYAIDRYKMHVIIGLHSLPGGVNSLEIGEAFGHNSWFNSTTNLQYSYKAVDAILAFIATSGRTSSFSIAPINEAADAPPAGPGLAPVGFGTSASLSSAGAAWVLQYFLGVIKRVEAVDKRIPIVLQDCFQGAAYWSARLPAGSNVVIDSHIYWFPVPDATPDSLQPMECGRLQGLTGGSQFPGVMGEWSLQMGAGNTFAARKSVFDIQRAAALKLGSGSIFWNAVSYSNNTVAGEGSERDYWSYTDLIKAGIVTGPTSPATTC